MNENVRNQEVVVVRRKDFEHLRGNKLGISEAARKYDLRQQTLSRWIQRGIVKTVGRQGRKVLVDEADVAFASAVYHHKGGRQGMRIFDDEGKPYIPHSRGYRPQRVVIAE